MNALKYKCVNELLTIFSKRSLLDFDRVLNMPLFSFDPEGFHLNLLLPPAN